MNRKILVAPADERKVWLSELQGTVPAHGFYVEETEEVKDYLKEGLLKEKMPVKKDGKKKVK